MKRIKIGIVSALAVFAFASVATASNEHAAGHARDVAAKQCAADKKADADAFKATWGEHAMRECIKATTVEAQNASKDCKAQAQDDPDGFAEAYGDGKNAHGKCVSSTVRAAHEAT